MAGMKEFKERLKSDAAFRAKFDGITDENEAMSLAKAEGYDLQLLSDEELDQVAGGTRKEYLELYDCFPKSGFGYGYKEIERWLHTCLGIDADIDSGYNFVFFVIQGDPNVYKRNGQYLSHQQVVEETKEYIKAHPNSNPHKPLG